MTGGRRVGEWVGGWRGRVAMDTVEQVGTHGLPVGSHPVRTLTGSSASSTRYKGGKGGNYCCVSCLT